MQHPHLSSLWLLQLHSLLMTKGIRYILSSFVATTVDDVSGIEQEVTSGRRVESINFLRSTRSSTPRTFAPYPTHAPLDAPAPLLRHGAPPTSAPLHALQPTSARPPRHDLCTEAPSRPGYPGVPLRRLCRVPPRRLRPAATSALSRASTPVVRAAPSPPIAPASPKCQLRMSAEGGMAAIDMAAAGSASLPLAPTLAPLASAIAPHRPPSAPRKHHRPSRLVSTIYTSMPD